MSKDWISCRNNLYYLIIIKLVDRAPSGGGQEVSQLSGQHEGAELVANVDRRHTRVTGHILRIVVTDVTTRVVGHTVEKLGNSAIYSYRLHNVRKYKCTYLSAVSTIRALSSQKHFLPMQRCKKFVEKSSEPRS